MKRKVTFALLFCITGCLCVYPQDSVGPNLLANGGFEAGKGRWWHRRGLYGGLLDPQFPHSGLYSWTMALGKTTGEILISNGARIKHGPDYQVSAWVRCQKVSPSNAIRLWVQQFSRGKPGGWYFRDKQREMVFTGGSHDWYRFSFNVLARGLHPQTDVLRVYLVAAPEATGTVWFDDVTIREIKGKPLAELRDAQAAPPLQLAVSADSADDAAPYREIPFLLPQGKGVQIDCGSNHNLFYSSKPARVTIRVDGPADGQVEWMVSDYFGKKVKAGTTQETLQVDIPEFGYFEVAARLTRAGKTLGAARTSFSHLPAHPFENTSPSFLLGSWVQQGDLLDDLGARWTRVHAGWRYLEPKPGFFQKEKVEGLDRSIQRFSDAGIQMICVFAKVPRWAGPNQKQVAPEHWKDFREFVRKYALRFHDRIHIWEVMNEPYIPALFPGTLEEVIQWHRTVREEVKKVDPDALIIGPCLNTRRENLYQEMRQLLERGLGKLVDGIAIHTYGGLEADGILEDFQRLRELLREFNADKPLYITEQGLSVPEQLPLERIQAQYMARMMLLCMEAEVRAAIWHMMSWPQGGGETQRGFAAVRARKNLQQRAPRPSFVAAAVLASILGKAGFVRRLPGFPDKVIVQQYESDRGPVLVAWDWGEPEREVKLEVGAPEVKVVNIVGRFREVTTTAGQLRVKLTPNPVYILGARIGK